MTPRRRRDTRRTPARGRGDGGYAPVEIIPVTIALICFLALILAAGRIGLATLAVHAAAQDAARQASIARTPAAAQTAARQSALAALAGDGLECAPQVTVDTSGFAVPVGQPARVQATVTCAVRLAGPGIPGTRTVTVTAASPLDPYRSR